MPRKIPSEPARRASIIDSRLLLSFILASVPAAVLGIANAGYQALSLTAANGGDAWPASAMAQLGFELAEPHWPAAILLGVLLFVPRFAAAAAASLAWAWLFANRRGRPLDAGWLFSAWFFSLLLPAGVPIPLVVWGLSFGVVFGCHVFGGTGRYIVSPALLGAVFLLFAYPDAMSGHWVPGASVPTTWSVAATSSIDTVLEGGTTWLGVAMGAEVAAIGTPAALACLAGALFLIVRGLASLRIVAGGLAGLAVATVGFDTPPWEWQPVLGAFAFALSFIATDPTTSPTSRIGRWALGLLFGAITGVIRMLNPEHPDGALFALLLATLLAPLIDHVAGALRPDGLEAHGRTPGS